MKRVYSDCYGMDARCYEEYGLSEDILMENASRGMADLIRERFPDAGVVAIVSGPGNNGADGSTLARQLYGDYDIRLYIPLGAKSSMAKLQLERCRKIGVDIVESIDGIEADIVVDALFGAGLSRPLTKEAVDIVERVNGVSGIKIACDIPTGLDSGGRISPVAVKADITVTMGALKEALYLDEAKDMVGEIVCVDLGISSRMYEMGSRTYLLEEADLRLPVRDRESTHKGDFGHAVIYCGEKEGAGIVSAWACSVLGAGLTTVVSREKVSLPPFLMGSGSLPAGTDAVAVGMGLGNHFDSESLRKEIVERDFPVVLDADALYREDLLSILEMKGREVVVTPHPKEFSAMWSILTSEKLTVAEIQKNRFDIARRFSERYPDVVMVLKGANSIISGNGDIYINPLGISALSKGGSGDVLSGLTVSLLAQGRGAMEAAVDASMILCASARMYDGNDYSMLAEDLIEGLRYL